MNLDEHGRGFMNKLDIGAFKYDIDDQNVSWKPRVNTHTLWLARKSAHPIAIHRAWPPAYLNRMWWKSCDIHIYNKVNAELLEMLFQLV